MKRLIIIRHANTEPQRSGQADIERSLTDEGRASAEEMAGRLACKDFRPDLFMTSPAARAFQTAAIFAGECKYPEDDIAKIETLYDGQNIESFLLMINSIPNEKNNVLIFGHNPTLSYLTAALSGGFSHSLSKTGIVGLSFDCDDWSEIEPGSGRIMFYITPNGKII